MKISTLLHPQKIWAVLVIAAMGSMATVSATPQLAPSGDGEVSDFIQVDVSADVLLRSSDISVSVSHHLAILTGTARTLSQAERAAARAIASPDVDAVVNQVIVKSSPDSKISQSAKQILASQKMIVADKIASEISAGRVTLIGSVGTWDERELARDLMSDIPGVIAVRNELAVTFEGVRTDSQIANQLRYVIRRDPLYQGLDIAVAVKNGVAKFNGQVGSRGDVNRLIRRGYVTGIMEVDTKNISVNRDLAMEAVTDKNYSDEQSLTALRAILAADPRINPDGLSSVVSNGVVTLQGNVDGLAASDAAESAARGIPGVLRVSNELRVQRQFSNNMKAASPPLLKRGQH